MAGKFITVQFKGADRIIALLRQAPGLLRQATQAAGREAAAGILRTEGLQKPPPETDANLPPAPFYIRGRGMQYRTRNLGNSERLGTQFYIEPRSYSTLIGNRASYAEHVVGEKQARWMKAIGWQKLADVARERLPQITETYQKWVDRALRKAGL